jgi:hypothetical protein
MGSDDPGNKYRDKVDPKHRMAMEAIGFMAQLLGPHREQFEILIKAEQDAHSFGHILDPTLYRDMIHSKGFEQQIRLCKAALVFLDIIDSVKGELEK